MRPVRVRIARRYRADFDTSTLDTACSRLVVAADHPDTAGYTDANDYLGDLSTYLLNCRDPRIVATRSYDVNILVYADWGQLDDVHTSGLVTDTFVEEMNEVAEESGVDDFGAVLYNFTSTIILETKQGDPDAAPQCAFDPDE